ncbi:hypothetical protein VTJ49DRAFT_2663 [Mycothermus thermophilus]|uniref:Uncharacterized protein n=1 Tax=Humicola insolens TaxID=85995 RepID=A0ABR3V9D6_HUMIN
MWRRRFLGGRGPRRCPSLDSVLDENHNWTVDYQDQSDSDDDSIVSYDPTLNRPAILRLKRGEEDKAVYEAWNLTFRPGVSERFEGRRLSTFGARRVRHWDHDDRIELKMQPSTQSELAEMHLQAVEAYETKHARCWPARAVCGSGRTYEEELDLRCRALPQKIRKVVNDLLNERATNTSNRYRRRIWTVVAMREQLQDRFAHADHTEVKHHKLRFWKNPKPEEPMLYTFIIRGAVAKVADTEDGFNAFVTTLNPWSVPDNAEACRRERERSQRRLEQRVKRRPPVSRSPSPSIRSRSPLSSARTWQTPRSRSASPPPYRSTSFRSGPTSYTATARSESPPPYRRSSIPRRIRLGRRSPIDVSAPSPPGWNCPPLPRPLSGAYCRRGVPAPTPAYGVNRPLPPYFRSLYPSGRLYGHGPAGPIRPHQPHPFTTFPPRPLWPDYNSSSPILPPLPRPQWSPHLGVPPPTYGPYSTPSLRTYPPPHHYPNPNFYPEEPTLTTNPPGTANDNPNSATTSPCASPPPPPPPPPLAGTFNFLPRHPGPGPVIPPSRTLSPTPPLPPAPNPYSCLTTPSLTSYGGDGQSQDGSPVLSAAASVRASEQEQEQEQEQGQEVGGMSSGEVVGASDNRSLRRGDGEEGGGSRSNSPHSPPRVEVMRGEWEW